jgi:hypothetical protein
MTIKGSLEYMARVNYIALYQQAKVASNANLKEKAECKRIANRSKTYFLLMTSEQAIKFFQNYPELWRADDESGIQWTSTANVAKVFEACKVLGITVYPLNVKHEDVPKDSRGQRTTWLEQKACELMTVMTGERFEWTGSKARGAHGSYRADGTSASGKKLEVKGYSSVMTCESAERAHNK